MWVWCAGSSGCGYGHVPVARLQLWGCGVQVPGLH